MSFDIISCELTLGERRAVKRLQAVFQAHQGVISKTDTGEDVGWEEAERLRKKLGTKCITYSNREWVALVVTMRQSALAKRDTMVEELDVQEPLIPEMAQSIKAQSALIDYLHAHPELLTNQGTVFDGRPLGTAAMTLAELMLRTRDHPEIIERWADEINELLKEQAEEDAKTVAKNLTERHGAPPADMLRPRTESIDAEHLRALIQSFFLFVGRHGRYGVIVT